MLVLKEGDFVSLDYTGKAEGKVFDTTKEDTAKKQKIYNKSVKYGPITIIIGAGQLLRGIDEALVGKNENENFSITLEPEKAFGKKNSKLLKIIPERVFKAQKVDVYPKAVVNFGNLIGYVVSVGSGRVIVDFNPPLAGKVLNYTIEIHNKVVEPKKQVSSIVEMYSGKNYAVEIEDGRAKITYPKGSEIKSASQEMIKKDVRKYVKLKDVKFVEEKQSLDNKLPAEKKPKQN